MRALSWTEIGWLWLLALPMLVVMGVVLSRMVPRRRPKDGRWQPRRHYK